MWIGHRNEIRKLTFRALALRHSLWRRANAPNVSFRISLRGGPIHIINPVDKTQLSRYTSHRRSTTVSLETYPSISPVACTSFWPSAGEMTFNPVPPKLDTIATGISNWSMLIRPHKAIQSLHSPSTAIFRRCKCHNSPGQSVVLLHSDILLRYSSYLDLLNFPPRIKFCLARNSVMATRILFWKIALTSTKISSCKCWN